MFQKGLRHATPSSSNPTLSYQTLTDWSGDSGGTEVNGLENPSDCLKQQS